MSKIRKSLIIDRVGIKRITDFKSLRRWLEGLTVVFEEGHRIQREIILGSGGMETPNWLIREATADDVTAQEARAVGNLIVEHKTNGTKYEFEAA